MPYLKYLQHEKTNMRLQTKKINSFLSTLISVFLLTACVTINIYFPAAAAEDAARIIVRDVLEEEEISTSEEAGDASDEQSSLIAPYQNIAQAYTQSSYQMLAVLLNIVVSPAHAEADININTPAITALRASMKSRAGSLRPYYANGAVGLTANAGVGIRDQAAIPLKQRNTVKKLLADENRDRSALYAEIARANNHPEWEADIRATFARVWVEEVPAGTWYQNANGAWAQK